MPYIKKEYREFLDPAIEELSKRLAGLAHGMPEETAYAGLLNYACTTLAMQVVKKRFGRIRYGTIATLTGVWKNIADEFYRRVAAPYEEDQIDISGDIAVYENNNKEKLVVVNGDKYWYKNNGERHRDNGPAIEYANGSKAWYQHDKLHRDDGPAIEHTNGDEEWYRCGKLHRKTGPAIKNAGNKYWYQHDKLHRDDGPAVEFADGRKEWWLNGELQQHVESNSLTIRWFDENGEFHREDGPAVEHTNGNKI